MKTKIFTLLLAVAASLGTMRATDVTLDGISYNLDTYELTAELTASIKNGDVIIPPSVEYNGNLYDVTSIANNAFSTGKWTSVVIPSSVTFISGGAFNGAQSQQYVEMESTTPPLVSSSSFPAALPVYVPCDALSTYKANNTWASFAIGYKPKSHKLTVTCNTDNKGTVKIVRNTICDEGDISTATLTVSPKYGYVFTMWNDGNTDNPRVIELSKDTILTAHFASNNTDVSSIIVDGNSYSVSTQVAVPVEYGYTGKPTIQITPSANTSTINVLQEANLPTIDTYWYEVVAENGNTKQYSITIYPVTGFTADDIIAGTQSHSIIATTTGSMASWWYDCATMIKCSEDWDGITSSSKYIEFRTTGKKEISFVRYLSYSGNGYDSSIPIRMWKSSEIDDNYIESTTRCSSNQNKCGNGGYSNLILPDGVQVLRIYGQSDHKLLGDFSVSVRNSEYYSIVYNYNKNEGSVAGPTSARSSSIVTFTAIPNEGYHFVQWNDGVTDNPRSIILSQDTTFSAEFAANTKYVVNFVDWNDSIISSMEVEEGYAAVAPANPSREGHEFTGWDKDFSYVTSNMTIKAQYSINYYPVGFLNYDGTMLSEQSIAYNQAAMAPIVPAREGYTFIGWTADIEHIVARTFAIALYEKQNLLLVTYKKEDGEIISSENVDLHLPEAPCITGKTFAGWLTESASNTEGVIFRATYTLDNPTESGDVTIEPSSTTAGVTFPYITGAMTYLLVIRDLFGHVVCKIMFNSTGHLLGIAFAPGRNNVPQQEQSTGFNFTVEGLTPNTTYEYEFTAHDESDQIIETLSGSFSTTADETGVNIISSSSAPHKIINEGNVLILRGDKTYTLQGQEVK